MADAPLYEVVGFDYAQAVRQLTHRFTYRVLIEKLGYESKGTVYHLINGGIPDHIHGEAIWALYVDTFGRKPPLLSNQTT